MNNAANNAADLKLVYVLIADGDIDEAFVIAEELFEEGAINSIEMGKIEAAAGTY